MLKHINCVQQSFLVNLYANKKFVLEKYKNTLFFRKKQVYLKKKHLRKRRIFPISNCHFSINFEN